MARLPFLLLLSYTLLALAACDVSSAASPAHHHYHHGSSSTTAISPTPSPQCSSQSSTTLSPVLEPRHLADAEDIEELRGSLSALQATLQLLLANSSLTTSSVLATTTRAMGDAAVNQKMGAALEQAAARTSAGTTAVLSDPLETSEATSTLSPCPVCQACPVTVCPPLWTTFLDGTYHLSATATRSLQAITTALIAALRQDLESAKSRVIRDLDWPFGSLLRGLYRGLRLFLPGLSLAAVVSFCPVLVLRKRWRKELRDSQELVRLVRECLRADEQGQEEDEED